MGLKSWIYAKTGLRLKPVAVSPAFVEMYTKKLALEQEASGVVNLFLGSSHGAYGVVPSRFSQKSFNLCTTSQDLYYSCRLYERCAPALPALRNVVCFFSVFSNGFDVSKTREKEHPVHFKYFFDIDPRVEPPHWHRTVRECANIQKKAKVLDNDSGYTRPDDFAQGVTVEERVATHLRENRRNLRQIKYLLELERNCRHNGHRLTVVTAPARSDYREQAGEDVFNALCRVARRHGLGLVDAYGSDGFADGDFGDFDHLNAAGAARLSVLIDRYLEGADAQAGTSDS